jgi:hypothetical protein
MRYYRFFSEAERQDKTATWGVLTTLYEVDDDQAIQRQLNLYGSALFVDRFDRSDPEKIQRIMNRKEGYARMRAEPLDVEVSRSNQISAEEFDFAWSTGALRERTFGEFKRELLNDSTADTVGVYEAWWYANGIFPHRPLSERLGMAERAIRELLAEGLVRLVSDITNPEENVIPREDHDEILRRWDTWVIGEDGIKAWFWCTELGLALNRSAWRTIP